MKQGFLRNINRIYNQSTFINCSDWTKFSNCVFLLISYVLIFINVQRSFGQIHSNVKIIPQSSYQGEIKKVILIYTKTAEVGIISFVDILKALPDAEITIISQFAPDSEEFGVFVSFLNQNNFGLNSKGERRLHFIQDDRIYGPWPRDQVLVDRTGKMWVSNMEQHNLRETILALNGNSNFQPVELNLPIVGANIITIDNQVLIPGNKHNRLLLSLFQNDVMKLPSPESSQFHLDLLIMPLSDNIITVGDVDLAREALLKLNRKEQQRLIAQWAVEYTASANNVNLQWANGNFTIEQDDRPGLILWQMLTNKIEILQNLLQPGAFFEAIHHEAEYNWDDQIAKALTRHGFKVIRLPFWPGKYGRYQGKKREGLPMLCYPNCLVWHDGILMPMYGIRSLDSLAKSRMEQATGKKVYPVRGAAILGYGYSGPHCLTVEFRN